MLRATIIAVLLGCMLLHVNTGDVTAVGNPWDYRMEYVVFGLVEDPSGNTVQVHINQLRFKLQVEDFIKENTELEFDSIETAPAKAASTMYIIIHVEEVVDDVWRDATNASVRCYIVSSEDDGVEDTHTNPDGTLLRWTDQINETGMAIMTILAPYSGYKMWLIPEIGLGGGVGWFRVDGTKSELWMYNPKKRVSYVVYSMAEEEMSDHLWLFHHTLRDEREALEFLNGSFNVSFSAWGTKEVLMRNTTVKVACFFEVEDMDADWEWVPLSNGGAILYLLYDQFNFTFDIYPYQNGSAAAYHRTTNDDGLVLLSIVMPSLHYFNPQPDEFRLLISAYGGRYDFLPTPIDDANWTFTVVPPPEVEIHDARILEEVFVGQMITIVGDVEEVDTGLPVPGVEVTLQGRHVSTTKAVTVDNGSFSIEIQAPIIVIANLTLDLIIEETDLSQKAKTTIHYDVMPPRPPPAPPPPPWDETIIIMAVTVAIVVSLGLFLMGRRGDRN